MAQPDWTHLALACLAAHPQAAGLLDRWQAFLRDEREFEGEACGQPARVRLAVEDRVMEADGHLGARWWGADHDYHDHRDAIDQWVQEARNAFPDVAFAVGMAIESPASPTEAAYGWVWWPGAMEHDAGFCLEAESLRQACGGLGGDHRPLSREEAAMSLALKGCPDALAALVASVRAQSLDERLPAVPARPGVRL